MTILESAILYHRRGINVLPIAAGTKRPPAGCSWKRWQSDRQTERDIRKLFAGDVGVGVILGAVSGNLYVRDFDKLTSYNRWSAMYPQLAGTLPTVATMRPGAHTYFTNGDRLATRKFDDGELRGDGAYVLAPPSRHPCGGCYSWRIPLGDAVPSVDPVQAGLIGIPEKKNGSGCTERTEEVSLSPSVPLCPSLYKSGLNLTGIASLAIPPTEHQNHHHLFQLARICYTINHRRNTPLSQSELQDVFNQWHRMAAKHLRPEQTRDEYYFEFLEGLELVKYEIGNEPIVQAWERAQQNPLPKVAMQFEHQQVRLLVGLCRELQRAAGDAPFYLSCRTVARLLGHDTHTTAANWLRGLALAKIIKVAKQGGPDTMKATRFHYRPAIEEQP